MFRRVQSRANVVSPYLTAGAQFASPQPGSTCRICTQAHGPQPFYASPIQVPERHEDGHIKGRVFKAKHSFAALLVVLCQKFGICQQHLHGIPSVYDAANFLQLAWAWLRCDQSACPLKQEQHIHTPAAPLCMLMFLLAPLRCM